MQSKEKRGEKAQNYNPSKVDVTPSCDRAIKAVNKVVKWFDSHL